MRAWFHCTGAALLARDPADTVGRLASAQQARGYPGTPGAGLRLASQIAALRRAVARGGRRRLDHRARIRLAAAGEARSTPWC